MDLCNKASFKFELHHKRGSLASILNVMSDCNLNLTKIQSLPKIHTPWKYAFFVDVTFDRSELVEGPNYTARVGVLTVMRNGQPVSVLRPESRYYPVAGSRTTEAAIRSTVKPCPPPRGASAIVPSTPPPTSARLPSTPPPPSTRLPVTSVSASPRKVSSGSHQGH